MSSPVEVQPYIVVFIYEALYHDGDMQDTVYVPRAVGPQNAFDQAVACMDEKRHMANYVQAMYDEVIVTPLPHSVTHLGDECNIEPISKYL